jgi:regulator of sigma E protease
MLESLFSNVSGFLIGYILPFLFVLTVVVFIHEMGHFLAGRFFGVGVKSFSIGFGPEIVHYIDKNNTRWRIAAIPLGGYVKFAGDANGASAPDHAEIAAMTPEERTQSFHLKPVWQRAIIVAAGPLANFILAITIFTGSIYIAGRQVLLPRIDTVQAGSAAERAGLAHGDLVLSIDGKKINGFGDIQRHVVGRAGDTLKIVVERAGREVAITAVPDQREFETVLGKQRIGLLGLTASRDPADLRHEFYGLWRSLDLGIAETGYVVERTVGYVSKLVVGRESADQLSGPIRIAQASGYVANVGFEALLGLTALLSVSIGLINLAPVPLLDGGHLMYYLFEAIRGRPMSERAQEFGFRIGMAFVIMLMLVATWNDVLHLGTIFARKGT